MNRNKMASQHSFAMIPRPDVPRSTYLMQQKRKQTFNGGQLVPFYCEEVLPGDHFQGHSTVFARMATPITAVLDNAELETFFFFVPNRILWDNWEYFIGGANFTIPKILSPAGGFPPNGTYDHFGLPCQGQMDPAGVITVNALPFRAINKIQFEWFRDENLQLESSVPIHTGDGPDNYLDYPASSCWLRCKKPDYFTKALPWPQKGTAVDIPLGTSAPLYTTGTTNGNIRFNAAQPDDGNIRMITSAGSSTLSYWGAPTSGDANVFADLSEATAATINQLRLAFQVQRLLERDARGGTRYTELLQAHFGVRPPDFRLQRPEYIGGGRAMVNTTPIPQTSSTDATTPQGNLAGMTTITAPNHRFKYAATEHGYIIGLVNVRADLTYQQGVRKHWTRTTRYDYYFPAFAHLGEQEVKNYEIFANGTAADNDTFGYQERWAELRYTPNEITGLFRSTATNSIDIWHYAEEFATRPALNSTFITDPSEAVFARSMAVGEDAGGQQILMDVLHEVRVTRPMPTYSVPGLIDHF